MSANKAVIFGKQIPTWILGVVLLLGAAGAAAGTVLSGDIQGDIPTTVGQSLVLTEVSGEVGFGSVSDDGSRFTAATEILTGESYEFILDMNNQSSELVTAELRLDIPLGISVDVDELGTDVTGLTRTGLGSWVMKIASNAAGEVTYDGRIIITVAHADDAPPGFYQIAGSLRQTAN